MTLNKVAGVVMGGILIIAAAVLVISFGLPWGWGVVMALIGWSALDDGLSNDEVEKKEDQNQINRGR